MIDKITAKLSIWLLRNRRLSGEERTKCLNALLDNLNALPIQTLIVLDNQKKITVNGKELDMESIIQLREAARSALHNQALKLINEQVAFMAVNLGVHQAFNNEQIVFAKSALWNMQETTKLLKLLAQEDESML